MASSATVITNGPTTSVVYINSLDRYSNGVPPPASSNQTTCADITYSVPGLANMQTCLISNSFTTSWWDQIGNNAVSAAFYTNIINLVDYTAGKTYLVTIPPSPQSIGTLITNLPKYVVASGFGGTSYSAITIVISANTAAAPYYDPVSAPINQWIQWYDNRSSSPSSLGWSRVTTAPDGTNISNRRQLFDILGLAGHVPSLAGVAGTQGSGYSVAPFSQSQSFDQLGAIRFVDVISPQLTPFAPDVSSYSNSSSGSINRYLGTSNANASYVNINRIFKVAPGSTTLQIKLVDDQGNLIPTNWPVPAPYQGALIAGVGIQNTTTSNLTFSGISNANVTFPTGTQVNILSVSSAPSGWNPGVYQVQSSTSNTVTIPYTCASVSQISNAASTFTIIPVWLTTKAGNQNGPEYTMVLTSIARTTTA